MLFSCGIIRDKFTDRKRQLGIPGAPELLIQNLNANTTITHHPSPITIPIIMTWKAPRKGKALPRKKLPCEELDSIQICLNNVISELEAKKANNGKKCLTVLFLG